MSRLPYRDVWSDDETEIFANAEIIPMEWPGFAAPEVGGSAFASAWGQAVSEPEELAAEATAAVVAAEQAGEAQTAIELGDTVGNSRLNADANADVIADVIADVNASVGANVSADPVLLAETAPMQRALAAVALGASGAFYARPVEFEAEHVSTCGGVAMIGLFDAGRLVFDITVL